MLGDPEAHAADVPGKVLLPSNQLPEEHQPEYILLKPIGKYTLSQERLPRLNSTQIGIRWQTPLTRSLKLPSMRPGP